MLKILDLIFIIRYLKKILMLKEWWEIMCESLTVPALVRIKVLSPDVTQYSSLLNEGQEMSNSTMKN